MTFAVAVRTRKVSRKLCTCPTTGNILILHKTLVVYTIICTLLKVVGYYDLSVLSMSVMGFQQIKDGWVGGVSSIQFFLNFFYFAMPLSR